MVELAVVDTEAVVVADIDQTMESNACPVIVHILIYFMSMFRCGSDSSHQFIHHSFMTTFLMTTTLTQKNNHKLYNKTRILVDQLSSDRAKNTRHKK